MGWLIKLTKDLRVQNYEMVTMPSDPHLEGSVRMELGNRLRALFHLGGHDYLFQGPNTYRTDTLYRRCSLFTISRDGRCDFEREYGIRIGGNLWIEKSKSPEVYHQPNPETRRLFRMQ